jgi:hypothetical protein
MLNGRLVGSQRPRVCHRVPQRPSIEASGARAGRVDCPGTPVGPPQGKFVPLRDALANEPLFVSDPFDLCGRSGRGSTCLDKRSHRLALGTRHVENATSADCGAQGEARDIPHVDRLNRPVGTARRQHPPTTFDPAKPPRQPADVLPWSENHSRPEKNTSIRSEGFGDSTFGAGLGEPVHRRTRITVIPKIRPGIWRAGQHRRLFGQRLQRPSFVDRDRRYEHIPSHHRFESARYRKDFTRHIAGRVDHRVPGARTNQAGEVVSACSVSSHDAHTGHVLARLPATERGDVPSPRQGVLHHSATQEPRPTKHQQTCHAAIFAKRGHRRATRY